MPLLDGSGFKLTFHPHPVSELIEAIHSPVRSSARLQQAEEVVADVVQLGQEVLHGVRTGQLRGEVPAEVIPFLALSGISE